MNKTPYGTNISDFDAVRLSISNPEDILDWSNGEVLKPETINYRTQKPERDGLFCEKIFGPVKDINPHDSKFKGMRAREMAVDKNGEIVTKSIVRRERMGHISLAAPVSHIWFLRGTPSAIGLLLNLTVKKLERVVYFASYVVKSVDQKKLEKLQADSEARLEAEKQAINQRYEKEAKAKDADLKIVAKAQVKEIEEVEDDALNRKQQLNLLVKYGLLTESEYRELPDEARTIIEVGMGAEAIRQLLTEIDLAKIVKELHEEAEGAKGQRRKKLYKRLKILESMMNANIKPSSMILSALPVIPPDLRPMVQLTGGRFATSDLNDLYRRVINRNNRLKKLINLNAPEVIRRNEMRMLQEAVDALIDNNNTRGGRAVSSTGGRRRLKSLSDMLKGKQGRFRQNLLGKRVDYSGRSVIVAGPELTIDECGLPKMMALELFKPFVIGELIINEKAHNIKSATRMIDAGENAVWDALDEVIADKYVLLNRAPTLHRLGIQAFKPRLIEGKAIQLHPLVCTGFNADFDGDQMAVHLPLSKKAQKEAREIMAANKNLLKPADGSPIMSISQDIVLGCYYMTFEKKEEINKKPKAAASVAEALQMHASKTINLQSPILIHAKGERRETTLGRVLFNEVFPEDFAYQNDPMTKKKLNTVMALVYQKYGQEITAVLGDSLKDLGFKYATRSGLSTGMDDYYTPDSLAGFSEEGEKQAAQVSEQYQQGLLTNEERYRLTVQVWKKVDKQILEVLEDVYSDIENSTSISINSGARGNLSNVKQIAGSLGVVADAVGKELELPVRSGYSTGLTPLESFTSTKGSRKGMISTALKTADSGYLTRRLVDVSQDVFTVEEDHKDPGFTISKASTEEIGLNFAERIGGRYAAVTISDGKKTYVKKGQLIAPEDAKEIAASDLEEIKIMSVLSSENPRGVSIKSYGVDMATSEPVKANTPVGVIAAQSIGEPGTQLTLNVFHAGGLAGEDISEGLPRVEELLEARQPKGEAFISDVDGVVDVWEDGDTYVLQVSSEATSIKTVELKGMKARVRSGKEVKKGDMIATKEGSKKSITAPIDGIVDIDGDQAIFSPSKVSFKRYRIPGFKAVTVEKGQQVKAGDRLTSGSINLQNLMALQGVEATQRYIMNEILRIFASQGQTIADKHLEIVVRQMFSRIQVEDPGESSFVTGDIVSKSAVVEANNVLKASKKKVVDYIQLLLGITKVSTWSDSFLSAASFQDTTRVLINAATSGKVDKLRGLKENVIIGRLIPVGTGVEPVDDED